MERVLAGVLEHAALFDHALRTLQLQLDLLVLSKDLEALFEHVLVDGPIRRSEQLCVLNFDQVAAIRFDDLHVVVPHRRTLLFFFILALRRKISRLFECLIDHVRARHVLLIQLEVQILIFFRDALSLDWVVAHQAEVVVHLELFLLFHDGVVRDSRNFNGMILNGDVADPTATIHALASAGLFVPTHVPIIAVN